ncbi:alkaline phosphatase family protein [Flavobacterium branchiophilum]|uniref:Probable phosphoglycerol transferase n=1 Tax=Flavobacterium branchiophilum (strain FL-15) TaxID=1034807 RepID=G2Z1I4_FLABF|nr:alkaline phosphatase family protein [Flavobacterium branchiophilum]CCB69752.1 Probable phosphoglycerol transferase [Flavobacterium branchiophilum FL-15]
MTKNFRISEYKILFIRILLAYLFYFVARLLFFIYNLDLLKINSIATFFELYYYGLAFDTTAILYANSLFILLSIIPFWTNTTPKYQQILFYIYFLFNSIAYSSNFIDFIYYKYTFARTTIVVKNILENETNKLKLFSGFLIHYWHVFLLLIITLYLWVYIYKKINIKKYLPSNKFQYFGSSIVSFLIIVAFVIAGIRGGDFDKSTRPINILDASKHVKYPAHSDFVLNTPFAIIRTMFSNSFQKTNYPEINPNLIQKTIRPIKFYKNNPSTKPNIVIFILESFGKEYVGAFNKNTTIPKYESHTPFIDSLAKNSLIFTNAYANGRQSIHGMSSVLAGIPSFKDAFTSSPYPKQKIESLVSTLESIGYETKFFHGAANGSMGFLGFSNILGINQYYGRTEYQNEADFDGFWGIWDEPFLQFMKRNLDNTKNPFLATIFTVSSHEPYNIPNQYKQKFTEKQLPIHKCIAYSDYSLKQFFNTAKKTSWFQNTIFVFVADHCNQIYYEEYQKPINHYAIPIMFYKPGNQYVGVNDDYAQQIDIYPTILDMIGYPKPFRSWGRSLVAQSETPFVINSNGTYYQFLEGPYICIFDGKKAIGFYDKSDKSLSINLITKRNATMNQIETKCKAFIQDYMERVIDKKLSSKN